MREIVEYIYYLVLTISAVVAILFSRRLKGGTDYIAIFLTFNCLLGVFDFLNENYFKMRVGRNFISHATSVVELSIVSAYLLQVNSKRSIRAKQALAFLIWVSAATINYVFFVSKDVFDTNLLILESFVIIAMSLWTLYKLLLNDGVLHISQEPSFWFSILFLVLWSSSFFFWNCLKIFAHQNWKYLELVQHIHAIVNILVVAALGFVFIALSKNKKA